MHMTKDFIRNNSYTIYKYPINNILICEVMNYNTISLVLSALSVE